MPSTAVLTPLALRSRDVHRILQLHAGREQMRYLVLVPVGSDASAVTEVINHLSLGDLRQAWQTLTGADDADADRAGARAALLDTLELFDQAGATATGALTAADPLPQVTAAAGDHTISELIVVTEPQAVQDILGRDWASQAEQSLDVPVLHFYSGTDHVA